LKPETGGAARLIVLLAVALLVGAGVGLLSFSLARRPAPPAVAPKPERPPDAGRAGGVVCLDPGHSPGPFPSTIDPASGLDVADSGGADGEVQTNWNIAVRAKELLERKGYTVRLTRPSVDSPANLRERADIGNACDINVRIHFDPSVHAVLFPAAGQTKSHGSSSLSVSEEVSSGSRALARALLPFLMPLGVTRIDNDMGGSSNNAGTAYVGSVLSRVPVVVIENDPAVVRDNPSGQERAAAAIAEGIDSYFKQAGAR